MSLVKANTYFFFHLLSKWIVSGLLGVDGLLVLKHVAMEFNKKRGQYPQKPKMEERNVPAVIKQQDHAIYENVQV